MFILRPSSPVRFVEPEHAADLEPIKTVAAETAQEVASDGEPYVDLGPPLPESYEVDIIRALLQDPFRIFIYWDVREESLQALTRYFSSEDAATFMTVLKLLDVEGGQQVFFEVGHLGRYWMMVFPDREYEFEIGVRSPVHGFISLARSNRVRTPRGTVSPFVAASEEYKLNPPEFINVLEASGFAAHQALEMTVAAVPGAASNEDFLASLLNRLSDDVREAIVSAGEGKPLTADMIEALPEPLRNELMKLFAECDGQVASAGLIHYLPELLREVIEDERELIGDHIHPIHLSHRIFLGGTEQRALPVHELRWPNLPRRLASESRYAKPDDRSGAGLQYRLRRE